MHWNISVCGNKLLVSVDQEGVLEDTFRLSCGHEFHKVRLSQTSVCPLLILFSPLQFCIRGWVTLSKKQTCPYCHEMLDLKRMFPKPWEKPLVMYGKLLGWVRWFVFFQVCWQPIIQILVQGINRALWGLSFEDIKYVLRKGGH